MLKNLVVCAIVVAPLAACAEPAPRFKDADNMVVAKSDVDLNSFRKSQGRPSLKESSALTKAAQRQSDYQKKKKKLSHTGSGGSTVRKRATKAGFKGCFWAENVSVGQATEAGALQAWMTSVHHRKNILSKNATHYGIAQSGQYWTLVLGGEC